MVERTNSYMLTSHMYFGVHPLHTHKHAHTPHTGTVLTSLHNSPNCLGCTLTSMLFSMSLHLFLSMKGVALSGSHTVQQPPMAPGWEGVKPSYSYSPWTPEHMDKSVCVCFS